MFKVYKEMFTNLRDMQDRLWQESSSGFPDFSFPSHLETWQRQTLEGMSLWAEKSVNQSLNLQQEWLEQWVARADSKKLKPKFLAELNTEARESIQSWLETQKQLWDQWMLFVNNSAGAESFPDLETWNETIQKSFQDQMDVLRNWSELGDFKKLSVKESEKLIDQITKSMRTCIEMQEQLWSQWFKGVSAIENPWVSKGAKSSENAPARQAKKANPKKTADSVKSTTPETKPAPRKQSAQAKDDLKQITGIGPVLEKKLNSEGITTLDQVAKLSTADIARLEELLRFPGRIKRDKWIAQAKKLNSKK